MELHIEKLKAIRKQKKISADELAMKAGISRVTLSAWENARRIPSEAKIRMLATALDIPVSEISDLEPDKTISKINLTPLGSSVGSILTGEKEKDINRHKNLVSGVMGIFKELSNAKLIIGAMISSLPSIFYIKGADLKYMTASEEFLKNLSLNKNFDVVGKTDYDFFPDNEAKINAEMDKYVIASGESIINKEGYIPGSRKSRWGIFSKIPIYDSERNIEGLLGFFMDITARRQAEQKIANNNKLLQDMIDSSSSLIYILDTEGRFVTVNRALEKLLGKSKDEIIGRKRESFIPEATAQVHHLNDIEVIKTQKSISVEEENIEPDGKHFYFTTKTPLIDNQNILYGVAGISTDITARKLTDAALRQSELFFKESQQAASIGSYTIDFISGLWESSEVLDQILGIDKSYKRTLQGWLDLVHPDDREMLEQLFMEDFTAKREPFSKEYRIIRKSDGAVRWVNDMGKVNFVSEAAVISMIGTVQDITERKELEEQLAETSRVHQVQLEMQSEELRRAHVEMDALRERYFDLYELAPVGFFTLSEKGLIQEANVTAATMLGMNRGALVKQPFIRYILPEDKDVYYLKCKALSATGKQQAWATRMLHPDGSTFRAYLQAVPGKNGTFMITLNDISGLENL